MEKRERLRELVDQLNNEKLGRVFVEQLLADIAGQIDIINPDEEDRVMLSLLSQASANTTSAEVALNILEYLLGVEDITDYLDEFLAENTSNPQA